MICLELFLGFLAVGLFSFGGAYSSIPLVRDVVLHYGWIDDELLTYMIAVSESTPGPFMINLATYIGSDQAGLLGSAIATAAVILPSFAIVLMIMALLRKSIRNQYVQAVLQGLKPCMVGIIMAMGLIFMLENCFMNAKNHAADAKNILMTLFFIAVFYGGRRLFRKKISAVQMIAASALAGIMFF